MNKVHYYDEGNIVYYKGKDTRVDSRMFNIWKRDSLMHWGQLLIQRLTSGCQMIKIEIILKNHTNSNDIYIIVYFLPQNYQKLRKYVFIIL